MFRSLSFVSGGRAYPGIYAAPSETERGALLIHGGGGLGAHERERGARLVDLGYAVYAPDLFGEPFRDRAHALSLIRGLVGDARELRDRVRAAWTVLASRTALTFAVGHCFGGLAALELARTGASVRGVVALHGSLSTSLAAERGGVRARILACAGSADPFCPPAQRAAFEDEMTLAGADWQLLVFGGAKHGFSVPGVAADGCAHDPAADRRSWQAMLALFDEAA